MFTARLTGVAPSLHALERSLDRQLEAAFERAGARVSAEAKATHPFQNRTGDLEASIAPLAVTGRASDNTLAGGTEATMPYASYVEDRPEFEFLSLAYQMTEGEFATDIERALNAAARNVGM